MTPELSSSLELPALPRDIQDSPERAMLWQYFVEFSSRQFQCWGVDNAGESYDPLAVLLLSMAASDAPLRLAALAFSAATYQDTQQPGKPVVPALTLYHEAVDALTSRRDELPAGLDSFLPALAAFLLLYRVEGAGDEPRTKLLSLAGSASTCMQSLHPHEHQQDMRCQVLMALLKWTEICTHASLFATMPAVPGHSYRTLSDFNFVEEPVNLSPDFEDWITHPIYAFSRRMVGPLLQIGRLVQQRRLCETWPFGVEAELSALEEDLLQAYDHDVEASSILPVKDPGDVLHVNEAMHAAAFIMYYTRLKDMPLTAPLIRRSVSKVQREAASVHPDSLSSRALFFPLFVAGCEAVDGSVRELIVERVLSSRRFAEAQPSKIVDCLRRVWEIRDQGPGLSWMEWSCMSELIRHQNCVTCADFN